MVDEPIDHGRHGHRVTEDLGPGAEGLVRTHDHRAPLVAGADEREEERCRLGVEGDVADLVDHEQGDARQAFELLVEPPRPLGCPEPVDPLMGGGEGDPMATAGSLHREGDRQMRLARARRAEEDDVLRLGEEVELGEMGEGRRA